jgi:hypothetical protein
MNAANEGNSTVLRAPTRPPMSKQKWRRRKVPRWRVRCAPHQAIGSLIPPEVLRVKRPIEVVVLNCCVTETKDAPLASRISTILAKSVSERVSRSIL